MDEPRLFTDVWNAVHNDEYMWIVVWGPPRSSKTRIAGWILYSLYKDWDKVLDAFVYNLSHLLYKLKRGLPELWPTQNRLHMRIPALNWDDFGAHSNKAETQYHEAWDRFKGGFDVLGTKIAVLIATMVSPTEPTFQIMNKYTHEVLVPHKGLYKYDKATWQQDFRGWRPKHKKEWIETNTFDPWPDEVYKQYDETRMSLADEVIQRIDDAMAETEVEYILKRMHPFDVQILDLIRKRGPVNTVKIREEFGDDAKKAVIRLKARNLIVPLKKTSGHYAYDVTDLGLEVRKSYQQTVNAKTVEKAVSAIVT